MPASDEKKIGFIHGSEDALKKEDKKDGMEEMKEVQSEWGHARTSADDDA